MLSSNEKELIERIINNSLDRAEEHWKNGGYLLQENFTMDNMSMESIEKRASEPSNIPGRPIVQDGETVISEFIALVMDMRDSSKHLMNDISAKTSSVTRLERIYYETSALLPAVEQTIKFKKGSVTEYLGDGLLALFKVDIDDKHMARKQAYDAAVNIIIDTRNILNEILEKRYGLPPIDLGVGLSISQTLVTLMGLSGNKKYPKAFGQCVFRATKLSNERNKIGIDDMLHKMWPTSKTGRLRFVSREYGSVVDPRI